MKNNLLCRLLILGVFLFSCNKADPKEAVNIEANGI
jgi:hypothetical protein